MLKGNTNEEKIYNFFISKGFNVNGACGILGNIHAESACNPINLQNSHNSKLGMSDTEYTSAVDNGKYQNFVKDSAGYGLCQWTYWSRKQALLNYARQYQKSIGDLEMQLNYLLKELTQYGLMDKLKKATSIEEATRTFMLDFEKPADQSNNNVQKRVYYSSVYYNRFATQLEKDVATLASVGIIKTPEYWTENAPKRQYDTELIHNMAEYVRKK